MVRTSLALALTFTLNFAPNSQSPTPNFQGTPKSQLPTPSSAERRVEPQAPAAPSIPDTPAGRILAAWLDAFNAGNRERLIAWNTAHRDNAPPIEATLRFRHGTGGFGLLEIESSGPAAIAVIAQERESDDLARIELVLRAADSPKTEKFGIRTFPRPPNLAVPRLGEAAAIEALARRTDELAAKDLFSGIVLVARHGKVLLQKTAGYADRDAKTPVTADTRFRLGSMNKMFTAAAILRLVEAGRLALDDAVGKHLTDYPQKDVASKVTIRHLLTHSGGTGDIFGPEFEKHRLSLRTHADYLNLYATRALLHEPGAEFRYSNYGYILLGAIIERISGTSYYDFVRRQVFEPAGMADTGSLPESEPVPNRSRGYMREGARWAPNTDTLPWSGTAAGGGYSTAGDLLKFARALEAGTLLSKATLAEATRPHQQNYGYGFARLQGEGAMRSYGHSGGAPGMNGDLRIFPATGFIVISLANVDPPAASRLADFFVNRMPAPQGP